MHFNANFFNSTRNNETKGNWISFFEFNNFGLTFKTGTNKSLWRFNTLMISGNNENATSDIQVNKSIYFGFGFKFGKEHRINIVNNLELRYGADLSFTYTHSKTDNNDKSEDNYDMFVEQITYQPGINLVFGFNYVIKNNLVIGAELLPNLSYKTGTSKEKRPYDINGNEVKTKISGFNYGLSNTSALLSLAYRF